MVKSKVLSGSDKIAQERGNYLDNAVIENFFGTLKSELFYLKKYNDISQLKEDIEE